MVQRSSQSRFEGQLIKLLAPARPQCLVIGRIYMCFLVLGVVCGKLMKPMEWLGVGDLAFACL